MNKGALQFRISARMLSTLLNLPKLSSFSETLTPDSKIATKEAALENANNVIRTPRILQDGAFSWTFPEKRKEYVYLTSSPQAFADLGLSPDEAKSAEFHRIVSGQVYAEQSDFVASGLPVPYSQAYAGWQFGQFAGQLGDGRVHNLFEVPKAHALEKDFNRGKYEVQLKGSGLTPYSRFADGKAVLRSSIREYIISEHLHAIGIPSTRALSLSYLPKTYAQRHGAERCAVVARFAELWIRLGTFDLYRWRFDVRNVKKLSQYVIDELFTLENDQKFSHFEELVQSKSDFFENTTHSLGNLSDFDKMYYEIIVRNATTTAMCQCYGFLNGVVNTDNTSVLGLAMDFGPFSIIDHYDPNFTPNSEDHSLRYSYSNTPSALWWNLTRLGEDLAHLIGAGETLVHDENFLDGNFEKSTEERLVKRATKIIEVGGEIFKYAYTKQYLETFFRRLGLSTLLISSQRPEEQLDELITPMLDMLRKVKCDFNLFFLTLSQTDISSILTDSSLFVDQILAQTVTEHEEMERGRMASEIHNWIDIFTKYVSRQPLDKSVSAAANPKFLPRNWILDEVIEKTQEGDGADLLYLNKLEKMAFNPHDPSKWGDELKDVESRWMRQGARSEDYAMLQCSCSS